MNRRRFLGVVAGGAGGASAGLPGTLAQPIDRRRSGEPLIGAEFAPLGHHELREAAEAVVSPDGTTAFVATLDGFVAVDISTPPRPQTLTHQSVMGDFDNGPLRGVADLSLSNDTLLVGGPYTGGGPLNGFALYDVSDPASPTRILAQETDGGHHNLFYRDGLAFVSQPGINAEQFVVYDLAEGTATERGSWTILDADPAFGDIDYAPMYIHDMWATADRAYVAHWDAGTFIIDTSNPDDLETVTRVGGVDPETMAEWDRETARKQLVTPPGNHHFVTIDEQRNLLGIGKESWAAEDGGDGGPSGIDLWDVTDETEPDHLVTIDPPPSPAPTYDPPDTTAHNFDLEGDRLYSSWYHGGVKIHDISDPSQPEELAWWRSPDEAAFWTAQRASDDVVIAASTSIGSYTTTSGLYTFPNTAGQQEDPPSLGGTQTATPSGDGSPAGTQTANETGDETSSIVPGFGVVPAIGAVGGVVVAIRELSKRQ